MSDNTYLTLCLVEGGTAIFPVMTSPTVLICELKEFIKEKGKNRVLNGVDAQDLKLWKVRMTMAGDSTTNSPASGYRNPPTK
jgi:hypothetical protein